MSEILKNNDFDNLSEEISLTHEELMKVTNSTLNELLKNDPVLHDLPSNVTLEEVEAQTALIHGQSIKVIIQRGENDDIPVIVKQKNSTVADLKRAFQRAISLKLQREGERYKISWKRMWRVYWLSCDGCKLNSDHGLLKEYGIKNKSIVTFVPKLRETYKASIKDKLTTQRKEHPNLSYKVHG